MTGKDSYGVPSDGKTVGQFNPGEREMPSESGSYMYDDADDQPASNGTPGGYADCVPKA